LSRQSGADQVARRRREGGKPDAGFAVLIETDAEASIGYEPPGVEGRDDHGLGARG